MVGDSPNVVVIAFGRHNFTISCLWRRLQTMGTTAIVQTAFENEIFNENAHEPFYDSKERTLHED